MKNIYPIGTALTFVWRFQNPDGSPIVFVPTRFHFVLRYTSGRGEKYIETFAVNPEGDGITWTLPAKDQHFLGPYDLVLDIYLDGRLLEHYYYRKAFTLYQSAKGTINSSQYQEGATINLLSVGEFYHFMTGEVINAPDEEDITSDSHNLLKFKDRDGSDGMGYVILRKNKSFAEQVIYENTIYEVRYDFDLGGESVTIPADCTIKFNGGKIQNGSLTCENTIIEAGAYEQIFNGVVLDGTIANKSLSACNFGVKPGSDYASANPTILNSYVIPSAENTYIEIVVPRANEAYYINAPISMNGFFNFICDGAFYYTGDVSAVALTIGEASGRPRKMRYRIKVSRASLTYSGGDIPASYGVKLININDSDIEVLQADSFAYGCAFVADTTGFCYNRITLGMIGGNSYCSVYCNAKNGGWLNENVFYDGHLYGFTTNPFKDVNIGIWLDGPSDHYINNNLFIKPCLEGNHIGWRLTRAVSNTLFHARIESVAVPTQRDDRFSANNILWYGYSASSTGATQLGDVPITQIMNLTQATIYEGNVPYIDYTYNGGNYHCSLPFYCADYDASSLGTHNTSTVRLLGLSLDVRNNKQVSVRVDTAIRFQIIILDDSFQPVQLSSGASLEDYIDEANSSGYYINSGTIYAGSDADFANVTFKSNVKYAFIGFRSGPTFVKYTAYGAGAGASKMMINNLPTNLIYGVPTSTANIKDGASYIYATNNKLVFYDQNSSTWRYADGTAVS